MPPQFAQMLPYLVAFVGLVVLSRRSRVPETRMLTLTLEE
jgi:simple sugar transport system permease protein